MTTHLLPKFKPPRDQVPAGTVLCEHCTAKCCRYFALPLDEPTTHEEWEYIRWFLLHDAASVFREDGSWYLLIHTVCKHLQSDNRCGIYNTRPQVCREYSTNDCEYEDDSVYEQYLETAEQVSEYVEAVAPPKRGASLRSPRPPLLPVIG